MKKTVVTIACCFLLIATVCARGVGAESYLCEINLENMPQDTAYIDMLVPIKENDERYVAFNEKEGIPKDSEIVYYSDDGFQSYTFHVKTAKSIIKPYDLNGKKYVEFFCDEEAQDINFDWVDYKVVRFAYLDQNGNILGITDTAEIWDESFCDLWIEIDGMRVMSETEKNPLDDFFDKTTYVAMTLLAIAVLVSTMLAIIMKIKSSKSEPEAPAISDET